VKVQLCWLPQASRPVQTTGVTPNENQPPGGGTQLTTAPASVVTTCGAKLTKRPAGLPVNTVRLLQARMGGVVSCATVTVKKHVAIWSHELVTRQLTVVLPNGNVLPEGGTQTTVGRSGQSGELTAGVTKFTTPELLVLQMKRVMFEGQ
jgi:hypothetical protein